MPLATISATIDTSPERVWDVIADFGGLQRWSRSVNSCTTEGEGVGSYRIVQIGDVTIRERLEASEHKAWYLRYRPISGSVMPVNDMVVSMALTALPDGKTKLDWSVEGEPTIDREKTVRILESRYRSRIEELKECLPATRPKIAAFDRAVPLI